MVSLFEYPLTIFNLKEGYVYQKYKTKNSRGRKLYKIISGTMFQAADIHSEWFVDTKTVVTARFKIAISPPNTRR